MKNVPYKNLNSSKSTIKKLIKELQIKVRWARSALEAVFRIHLLLMRIQVTNISLRFNEFFLTKQSCQIIFLHFSLIFMLNSMNHSEIRNFLFFSQFLVDILLFGSLISEKVSGVSV